MSRELGYFVQVIGDGAFFTASVDGHCPERDEFDSARAALFSACQHAWELALDAQDEYGRPIDSGSSGPRGQLVRATCELFPGFGPLTNERATELSVIVRGAVDELARRTGAVPEFGTESQSLGGEPDASASQSNELKKTGSTWKIVFDGRSEPLQHRRGLLDIATLLGNPERDFAARELMGRRASEGPLGEALDRRAIGELKRFAAEASTPEERDEVEDFLRKNTKAGDRPRLVGTQSKKDLDAVRRRIKTALKAIGEVHPAAGSFIDARIRKSPSFRYSPGPDDLGWDVDS